MNPAAERPARGPFLELRFDQGVPVLVLDEISSVEALRAAIRNSMPEHLTAIAGRSTRLDIGTREITLFDLRRVIHMLRQDYSVEITGLYVRGGAIHRFAERELKLKLFVTDPPPPLPEVRPPRPAGPVALDEEQDTEEVSVFDDPPLYSAQAILEPTSELEKLQRVTLPHDIDVQDLVEVTPVLGEEGEVAPVPGEIEGRLPPPEPTPIARPWGEETRSEPPLRFEGRVEPQDTSPPSQAEVERRSCTLHRTLRSGAIVRFDGDLYVFGDVNPGAQVVATGNIIVLGALKGLAHAGAAGDESSFILAFDLRPTQLRIGRKIAVPPPRRSSAPPPSELATVQDGHIVIEAYRGRVRTS